MSYFSSSDCSTTEEFKIENTKHKKKFLDDEDDADSIDDDDDHSDNDDSDENDDSSKDDDSSEDDEDDKEDEDDETNDTNDDNDDKSGDDDDNDDDNDDNHYKDDKDAKDDVNNDNNNDKEKDGNFKQGPNVRVNNRNKTDNDNSTENYAGETSDSISAMVNAARTKMPERKKLKDTEITKETPVEKKTGKEIPIAKGTGEESSAGERFGAEIPIKKGSGKNSSAEKTGKEIPMKKEIGKEKAIEKNDDRESGKETSNLKKAGKEVSVATSDTEETSTNKGTGKKTSHQERNNLKKEKADVIKKEAGNDKVKDRKKDKKFDINELFSESISGLSSLVLSDVFGKNNKSCPNQDAVAKETKNDSKKTEEVVEQSTLSKEIAKFFQSESENAKQKRRENLLSHSLINDFLGGDLQAKEKANTLKHDKDIHLKNVKDATLQNRKTKKKKQKERNTDDDQHSLLDVESLRSFEVSRPNVTKEKTDYSTEGYMKALESPNVSKSAHKDEIKEPSYIESDEINSNLDKKACDEVLVKENENISSKKEPKSLEDSTVNQKVKANEPVKAKPFTVWKPMKNEVALKQAVQCVNKLLNNFESCKITVEEQEVEIAKQKSEINTLIAQVKSLSDDLEACKKEKAELVVQIKQKNKEIEEENENGKALRTNNEVLKIDIFKKDQLIKSETANFNKQLDKKDYEIRKLKEEMQKKNDEFASNKKKNEAEIMELNKTMESLKRKIEFKSEIIKKLQQLLVEAKKKQVTNSNDIANEKDKSTPRKENIKQQKVPSNNEVIKRQNDVSFSKSGENRGIPIHYDEAVINELRLKVQEVQHDIYKRDKSFPYNQPDKQDKPQTSEQSISKSQYQRLLMLKSDMKEQNKLITALRQSLSEARNDKGEYKQRLAELEKHYERVQLNYESNISHLKMKFENEIKMLENELQQKKDKVTELELKLVKEKEEKEENLEELQTIIQHDHRILMEVKQKVKIDSENLEKIKKFDIAVNKRNAKEELDDLIKKKNEKIVQSSQQLDDVIKSLQNVGKFQKKPMQPKMPSQDKLLQLKFTEVSKANNELRQQLSICESNYNICKEENTRLQVDIKEVYKKLKDSKSLEKKCAQMKDKMLKLILQNKSLKSDLAGKESLLKSLNHSLNEYKNTLSKHESTNMHCCFQIKLRKENLEEQVAQMEEKLTKYIGMEKQCLKYKDSIDKLKAHCQRLISKLDRVERVRLQEGNTNEINASESVTPSKHVTPKNATVESGAHVINFNVNLDQAKSQAEHDNSTSTNETVASLKEQNKKLMATIENQNKNTKEGDSQVKIKDLEEKVDELSAENEKLAEKVTDEKVLNKKHKEKIRSLQRKIEEFESEIELLEENIEELKQTKQTNEKHSKQAKDLKSANKDLVSKNEELASNIEKLEENTNELLKSIEDLKDEKAESMKANESELARIKEEMVNEKQLNVELSEMKKNLEERLAQLQEGSSKHLRDEIQSLRSKITEISSQKQNCELLIKSLKEEKASLLMDNDRLRNENTDLMQKQNFHTVNTQRRNAAVFADDEQASRVTEVGNAKIARETPLLDGNKLNATNNKKPLWLASSNNDDITTASETPHNASTRRSHAQNDELSYDNHMTNSRRENMNGLNYQPNVNTRNEIPDSNETPKKYAPSWLQPSPRKIQKPVENDDDDIFKINVNQGSRRRDSVPIRGNIQQPVVTQKREVNTYSARGNNDIDDIFARKRATNQSTWSDEEGDFIRRSLGRK